MPPPPRFLVVEYDGAGLPFIEWARDRPRVRLDMILEPMRAKGDDLQIPGVALVRGLDADAMRELDALLGRDYAPVQTLRRDARRGEWLGRLTLHVARMRGSPTALAIARMSDRFGPPWSHVDDGIVHMRLRIGDGVDADALAAELADAIRGRGGEAQVSVESFASHDYGVWDELVQAAIGLRP